MRIDKYLKLTRLIKRRTVAKELLDRGEFLVNGRTAKPSSDIKVGDILVLVLGRHKITIEVLQVLEYCRKDQCEEMYTILKDEICDDEIFKA